MGSKIRNLKLQLEEMIKKATKVYIIGHNEPDFDSIGSAIGLQVLCKILGKKSYIIIDDADAELEPGVKKIKEKCQDRYNIISSKELHKQEDPNILLIMTDVNKASMVSINNEIPGIKNIVIIDHHEQSQDTVPSTYKLIDTAVSSASEIVAQILNSYHHKYDKEVASFLLAGIVLDTKRYMKNTSPKTHDVAEKLIRRGANADYVNELFLEEFDNDRKINDLVFNGTQFKIYEQSAVQNCSVSFTLNRNAPGTHYKKEDVAKASDKMLKYPIDAAFVLGFIQEGLISISARSRGNIDVGEIMSHMNGGGNPQNAGAKIVNTNILEVEKNLMQQVEWGIAEPDHQESVPYQKSKTSPK